MLERHLLPAVVALGLLAVAAVAVVQHRAPDRVRAGAAAAGRATTEILVREMG